MAELTRRYIVMQMATEGPFDIRDGDAPFVLKPWKDPAALHALRAYADRCYPELARDLAGWIRAIDRGAVVRGDVGRRNEAYQRPAAKRPRPAAKRPRPAAKPRRAKPAPRPSRAPKSTRTTKRRGR